MNERANALLREMEGLRAARNNANGLELLGNKLIAELHEIAKYVLPRMRKAAEHDESFSPQTFINQYQQIVKSLKDGKDVMHETMKMTRLLVGMPQQITEHRTDEGRADEKGPRLTSILGRAARGDVQTLPALPYAGEEAGLVGREPIDVESVPVRPDEPPVPPPPDLCDACTYAPCRCVPTIAPTPEGGEGVAKSADYTTQVVDS